MSETSLGLAEEAPMYLRKLGSQGDFMEVVTERPQGGRTLLAQRCRGQRKPACHLGKCFEEVGGWLHGWKGLDLFCAPVNVVGNWHDCPAGVRTQTLAGCKHRPSKCQCQRRRLLSWRSAGRAVGDTPGVRQVGLKQQFSNFLFQDKSFPSMEASSVQQRKTHD